MLGEAPVARGAFRHYIFHLDLQRRYPGFRVVVFLCIGYDMAERRQIECMKGEFTSTVTASSDARQNGGTAPGLNISKAMLERMGGHIDFVSMPDEGATF